MPDPLQVLPNELWSLCIDLAIDGRLNGPLDFLMVSMHWERLLINSPSLWTQIYIQNGEDEMARISTFLRLSKQSPLHVDVMTVLPTVNSLQLVAEHISRVVTILIRPGGSGTTTVLHANQWKLAASYVFATLSNGMQLTDVESPSCLGLHMRDHGQSYYHVIFVQFTVDARVASTDQQNHMWERQIEKIIPGPAEDSKARIDSISSIAELAPYARFHDVIKTTIPSLIQLLEAEEGAVQWELVHLIGKLAYTIELREAIATTIPLLIQRLDDVAYEVRGVSVEVVGELANHVELREAIAITVPSLIRLLEDNSLEVRLETVQVVGNLANHVEFREAIATAIPSLIKLLGGNSSYTRWKTIELIGKLANHVEFREAIATMIPPLIKLLGHENHEVQWVTVEVIGQLANHVEFREGVATTIPSLIKLLKDGHYRARREAIRVVDDMKNSGMFQLSLFAFASGKGRVDDDNGGQR